MSEDSHDCHIIIKSKPFITWNKCCLHHHVANNIVGKGQPASDHYFASFCLHIYNDFIIVCEIIQKYLEKYNKTNQINDFIILLIRTEIYHVTISNENWDHIVRMISKIDYLLNHFCIELTREHLKRIYKKIGQMERNINDRAYHGNEIFRVYKNRRVVDFVWIYFKNIKVKTFSLNEIIFDQIINLNK